MPQELALPVCHGADDRSRHRRGEISRGVPRLPRAAGKARAQEAAGEAQEGDGGRSEKGAEAGNQGAGAAGCQAGQGQARAAELERRRASGEQGPEGGGQAKAKGQGSRGRLGVCAAVGADARGIRAACRGRPAAADVHDAAAAAAQPALRGGGEGDRRALPEDARRGAAAADGARDDRPLGDRDGGAAPADGRQQQGDVPAGSSLHHLRFRSGM